MLKEYQGINDDDDGGDDDDAATWGDNALSGVIDHLRQTPVLAVGNFPLSC